MVNFFITFAIFLAGFVAQAQLSPNYLPKVPTSTSTSLGITGSVGVGFSNFSVLDPSSNFALDRGTYMTVALERGFDVANLYFAMSIGNMKGTGHSNYSYRNLSSVAPYTATDVAFNSNMYDLSIGFKIKLIDKYWFGPYIEGGGMGTYQEINYISKLDVLDAQGTDAKKKDVVMGSGYYGEAGLDVQFSNKFGLKFAGRFSELRTKDLETLGKSAISMRAETYYFSAMMGF